MFSYLHFECWQTRGRFLNSWNGYQTLYIAINWFSDSVQAGIFMADHESGAKMNANLLNRGHVT